jgi:hypothetical protein
MVAAVIAFTAAWRNTTRSTNSANADRKAADQRAKDDRDAATARAADDRTAEQTRHEQQRCWDRFTWAVDREKTLDPETLLVWMINLKEESSRLGDDTLLVEAINSYIESFTAVAVERLRASTEGGQ